MGTLNTTINLNSTDSLPFSINQTIKSSGTVGNFIESGVKTVSEFNRDLYGKGPENLSVKNCGPHGAYIFVSNPIANTATVKLYAEGNTDNEYVESFATLKPGDSMLVPLTAQQKGVYAATTFGTCSIDYYIADRGGEFGQSALMLINDGNWRYKILDAEIGEVLPTGNPTIDAAPVDLGLSVSTWSLNRTDIINNKGYVLTFYNSGTGTYVQILIKSDGTYENFSIQSSSNNYSNINGHVNVYCEDSIVYVTYFDGKDTYSQSIPGNDYNVRDDWDNSSSDGSFIIDIKNYNSTISTATVLINKDQNYVLYLSQSLGVYPSDAAVYFYGNFTFVTIYDDNNGWYNNIQIFNTKGVLLQDIDISSYQLSNLDYNFYGTNKIQMVFYDGDVTNYMLNYNGTTNKLIGYDYSNGQLNWHHAYSDGRYQNYFFYAYSKSITDSIRSYAYIWNSGMFDAESMAIVYVDSSDYFVSTYFINSELNYCDIVYLMDGATSPSTYTFANNEDKFIRIPYESNYSRVVPSSKQITFSYSTSTPTSGSLNALVITPTSVATSSIADLSVIESRDFYSIGNPGISFKPVGDYVMYSFYNNNTNVTTYTMLKSTTVKDSVNIAGEQTYYGVWRSRINSLLLRSWNYNTPRNWYFNTSTNKFVELTAGGSSFNTSKPFYPQHYWNESATVNGLNDGNLLLGPYNSSNVELYNNNMRMLKKGTVTGNVTLPTAMDEWRFQLGSEAVFFIWVNTTDYNTYLKVYDLNLNLKNTIQLSFDGIMEHARKIVEGFEVIGKRGYVYQGVNVDGDQYYMMVSLSGIAYWVNSESSENPIFNDQFWWDYIA